MLGNEEIGKLVEKGVAALEQLPEQEKAWVQALCSITCDEVFGEGLKRGVSPEEVALNLFRFGLGLGLGCTIVNGEFGGR
ncbi:MAG: hypothetical protein ABIH46_06795 [Chloroflexota bacterium]